MNTQLELFEDDSNKEEIVLDENSKVCVKCKTIKHITDFRLHAKAENIKYRRPECKDCEKEYAKTRDKKTRSKLRPKIGTPCECCGKSDKSLVYDHRHSDNKFRGWICQSCNIGIGRLGDCIEGVEKAVAYLLKSKNP
jgi:hypothetical protein